jgi:hypothetical protein
MACIVDDMKKIMIIAAVSFGLTATACTRGGRSPEMGTETIAKTAPPPGSGQTGPGMTTRVNQVNGMNDSSGVAMTDGHVGIAGPGDHQEHNRLPGTGERP